MLGQICQIYHDFNIFGHDNLVKAHALLILCNERVCVLKREHVIKIDLRSHDDP